MSKMGNSSFSRRQQRRENEGGGVDGDQRSAQQPGIESDGTITVSRSDDRVSGSSEGARVNNNSSNRSERSGRNAVAAAIEDSLAAEMEEEEECDSSDDVMVLGCGGEEETSSDEEEEDDDATVHLLQLPTLRLLAQLLGRRATNPRQCETEKPLPPPVPMNPACELYSQVLRDSGRLDCRETCSQNILTKLAARQLYADTPTEAMKVSATLKMFPEHPCLADSFDSRAFCGTYSKDGSVFISAVQDNCIYLYDTNGRRFKCYKSVSARDVGWSILDTALSPDQQWFVYSTWSPCVHVCNVSPGDEEKHYSLDLLPHNENRFCAFAARFSNDGNEIVASASDGFLYVYNRDRCERTLRIDAHQDDANAVAFADDSSHIVSSGGDDGICKVWDRRTLSEANPTPVGFFAGHKDGITFIDSKGDGRYLITNSKDQSIKLWDLRKFSTTRGEQATLDRVRVQMWDYRWENVPKSARKDVMTKLTGDTSVMTYAGHTVKNTLLRCRFSPMFTTGQSYIYTACARGRVIIYDVLTGEIVKTMKSMNCFGCIRDVSWHPTEPGELVATSWDGVLQMWTYKPRTDYITNYRPRRRGLFEW